MRTTEDGDRRAKSFVYEVQTCCEKKKGAFTPITRLKATTHVYSLGLLLSPSERELIPKADDQASISIYALFHVRETEFARGSTPALSRNTT
jgi:hypothetical protein